MAVDSKSNPLYIADTIAEVTAPIPNNSFVFCLQDNNMYYINNSGTAVIQNKIGSFGMNFLNFGLGVLATGSYGKITIPFTGVITKWYLSSTVSGSVQIDIKRAGVSIIGAGNKPILSGAVSGNAAPAGWTSVAVTAGDIIEFVVDSSTTVSWVNLVLECVRTT